jgi:hypothetical protein
MAALYPNPTSGTIPRAGEPPYLPRHKCGILGLGLNLGQSARIHVPSRRRGGARARARQPPRARTMGRANAVDQNGHRAQEPTVDPGSLTQSPVRYEIAANALTDSGS